VGRNSLLQQVSRISLRRKASLMSHRDARHVVTLEKTVMVEEESRERCLMLFVLPVVRTAKFLSS
jgi:hypothetical protein